MRPPSTTRDPVAHWRAGIKADTELPPEVRRHLLSVAGQVWADVQGASVVHKATAAVWLATYARAMQRAPDMLTQARALAELVRAARAIGLLSALDRTRGVFSAAGRGNPFRPARGKRGSPFTPPRVAAAAVAVDDDEREQGDE